MATSFSPESAYRARKPKFNTDPASLFENGRAGANRMSTSSFRVASRNCGTTAASATVTCTDTSGLTVGMMVAGPGVGVGQAAATQGTGETFTINTHGAPNGTPVYLTALGTTTGFELNKIYYVVSTAANTFQLAETPGGSALPVDVNGTATVVFCRFVTAITPNASFAVSVPAAATAAGVSLRFAQPNLVF
jgi:hypothetical protein